ncbi:MAG: S8/S53 family peptidase [Eubacterium sp.]|nr:S8/S53 family peptidase [Eubacterium sp.]
MNIAVIDDFGKKNHKYFSFESQKEFDLNFEHNRDDNISHGERVVRTFYKYNKSNVTIQIICVRSMGLKECFQCLLGMNIDMILLCFTIKDKSIYNQITEWIDLLVSKGAIIICSCSNNIKGEDFGFPANHPAVLGVIQGVFLVADHFYFDSKGYDKYLIYADAAPEFIKVSANRYCIFGGTSKAVPKFAAGFVNALERGKVDKSNIVDYLSEYSCIKDDVLFKQCKTGKLWDVQKTEVNTLMKIVNVLDKYLTEPIDTVIFRDVSINDIWVTEEIFAEILIDLFKLFDLQVKIEDLHFCEFMSVHSLARFIEKQGVHIKNEL